MSMWILALGTAFAQSAEDIIKKAMERRRVDNSFQVVDMTIEAKNGGKQYRTFELTIRRDDDAVRSYTKFISPPALANTQFVVVDQPDKNDPQLMYLPSLKRVQRIAGKARKGSFMGSDFSYADLEVSLNGDETHTIQQESDSTWVIESNGGQTATYAKWVSHISKETYLPEKVDFYDKRGKQIKTLVVEQTKEQDGMLIPTRSKMINRKRGTKTILEVKSIQINLPPEKIPLDMFTPSYMEEND